MLTRERGTQKNCRAHMTTVQGSDVRQQKETWQPAGTQHGGIQSTGDLCHNCAQQSLIIMTQCWIAIAVSRYVHFRGEVPTEHSDALHTHTSMARVPPARTLPAYPAALSSGPGKTEGPCTG